MLCGELCNRWPFIASMELLFFGFVGLLGGDGHVRFGKRFGEGIVGQFHQQDLEG
jgi:hypothetical protein